MAEMTWRDLRDKLNTLNNKQLDRNVQIYLDWNDAVLGLVTTVDADAGFSSKVKAGWKEGSGEAVLFSTLDQDDFEFLRYQIELNKTCATESGPKPTPTSSIGNDPLYDLDPEFDLPFDDD